MRPYFLILSAFLLYSFSVSAQVTRNANEAIDNKQDLKLDRAQLNRDMDEVAKFKADLVAIENAWKASDLNQINANKNQLVAAMKREIEQSENKLNQARNEVSESKSEVRSDNREIKRDRKDSKRGRDVRDDRRDLARDKADKRDDVRDLNDDIQDKNGRKARLENQRRIYETLKAYQFANMGTSSNTEAATKKALMYEFLQTMENDLAATRAELGEDKVEKVEDRRERKDDKRERRER
jgi:hypothetical protein